jgi:hypothetical protein
MSTQFTPHNFSLKLTTAVAALGDYDFPPPIFAAYLIPFLEDCKFWEYMQKIDSPEEELDSWLVRLFFPVLRRFMKADMRARLEPHFCAPECPCCQHVSGQIDHLVWSDVTAKVARLIKDPSTTESKELMEKYAKAVLKNIEEHLMYD